MTPDISTALSWLEDNPQALNGIHRGIEREGLRIETNGTLARTPHPKLLGSSLTHKWITTDFAEALLEFITPVESDINYMLTLLYDIHIYVIRRLNNELLWPMSMPCSIDSNQPIELAQYGNSNIGRMKTLYREGLKNRYSAIMQIIAGVHYNFSLPLSFWQVYANIHDEVSGKEEISSGYLRLIRNFHRLGWIIPYLFGASPGICPSFLNGKKTNLPFQYASSGLIYLPYATSLRLSDLGYTNKSQDYLGITFNHLDEYIHSLKRALKTPSAEYQRMGLQSNGRYLQLNTNILQIENELYAPIRPKRVTWNNEYPSDALIRGGIEYIEVRSLDINPFSPVGVDEEQLRFLDLLLIWCIIAKAPEMNAEELLHTRNNWNKVTLEGRKPGIMLSLNYRGTEQPLTTIGKLLFKDLRRVAIVLDNANVNKHYQKVCDKLVMYFDHPELTLSARLLDQLIKYGVNEVGLTLANKHYYKLYNKSLQTLNEKQLNKERLRSLQQQHSIENKDHLSFDEFLNKQIIHKRQTHKK